MILPEYLLGIQMQQNWCKILLYVISYYRNLYIVASLSVFNSYFVALVRFSGSQVIF